MIVVQVTLDLVRRQKDRYGTVTVSEELVKKKILVEYRYSTATEGLCITCFFGYRFSRMVRVQHSDQFDICMSVLFSEKDESTSNLPVSKVIQYGTSCDMTRIPKPWYRETIQT